MSESYYNLDGIHILLILLTPQFEPEQNVWLEPLALHTNVTVLGFSPVFPQAHCNKDYSICQITTGESEINAAATVTALYLSPLFDLKKTYFLIAGIAGVNPYEGTLGSAAFARYAVQVALQYEVDAREIPSNWSTGYFSFGRYLPEEYPIFIYGSEVFEVNVNLRDKAIELASNVRLNDSANAIAYRAKYPYAPANQPPKVIAGDSATSDVYYTGHLLSESFGNFTKVLTNGSGVYVTTAQVFNSSIFMVNHEQEDNATLEALVRAALAGLVDFARIVVLRTCSDFDRPPPGVDPIYHLTLAPQGGFLPALQNIFLAGRPFVDDVVEHWEDVYEAGIAPSNYLGDIFGTLSYLYGPADFGPAVFGTG
jgi:purine nucleoside permease